MFFMENKCYHNGLRKNICETIGRFSKMFRKMPLDILPLVLFIKTFNGNVAVCYMLYVQEICGFCQQYCQSEENAYYQK